MDDVVRWTFEKRLEETLQRTIPRVGPEARDQLKALVSPTALKLMAGVLIAWVASHAIGIGEIIDLVIGVVGAVSIGVAVFSGLDHLYDFAAGVYLAKTSRDLDAAADNLAKAIALLGIQAVLAVLFRGAKAPKTGSGGRMNLGTAPRTPGMRFRPSIVEDASLKAGQGSTSFWGNITVSARGTAAEKAVVLLHEKVHQFLMPKLYILREYRASNRAASYVRSSLWRFIEEALAETIAQVGVNGVRTFFSGVKFPVAQGYMYLMKAGSKLEATWAGSGIVPEGAALLYNAVVSGIAFELWFLPTPAKSAGAQSR